MKRLIIIFIIILLANLFAEEGLVTSGSIKPKYSFDENTPLDEVCRIAQVPYKKMAEYLKINPNNDELRSRPIRDFDLTVAEMTKHIEMFKKDKLNYSSTVAVFALFVTFLGLGMISLAIMQLVHFSKKITPAVVTEVETPVGKVIMTEDHSLNSDVVVAVVAAIERFRAEKIKEHKILLTWRRANVSMWQASGKVDMRNNVNLFRKR